MKKIEFIGSSAAGKSTLLKSVIEKRSIEDRWSTPEEAKDQLIHKLKYEIYSDKRKYFIPYIYKYSNVAYHHLQRSLVKKYKDDVFDSVVPDYNGLLELLIQTLANHNKLEAHKRIKIISYYFQILIENVALLEYLNYEGTVVYDECLIHNNLGCTDQNLYEQMLKKYPEKINKINPDGIIFCSITPEENLKRRKKRFKNGTVRFFEKNLNEDELLKLCAQGCISAERKAKVMHNIGIPVLEIDMSKGNEENALLILSLISKIDKQEVTQNKVNRFTDI